MSRQACVSAGTACLIDSQTACLLAPAQGDSDVRARGASETEAAAGGRHGSGCAAANQGGGAERGWAPGHWGARVVTALLRRIQVRAAIKPDSSAGSLCGQ
jgi:hypothetical protein